uniref:PH domain-containing protein n=1 Tax=Enterobius vermicularis TaxID=51028 RepID=A0A0N4VGJ2_ENTVE
MYLLGKSEYCEGVKPPALPLHRPPNQWEAKLYQIAERCLSSVLNEDEVAQCSGTLNKIHLNDTTNGFCSSLSKRSGQNSRVSKRSENCEFFGNADYAVPLDAVHDIRTTMVNSGDLVEKSGYLIQMTDSRLKSLKRRYFVLRDGYLALYRAQKNYLKGDEPLVKIAMSDIRSVTKVTNKFGSGLQIVTINAEYCYCGESEKITEEWLSALNRNVRSTVISEVSQRALSLNAQTSGYIVKAKCGSSKRFFASVIDDKLFFFKNPEDRVPYSQLFLKGAVISEKAKNSSDEYSGSSDEQSDHQDSRGLDYTISIEMAGSDPVYMVVRSAEEKERWIYFLKKAAGDSNFNGTEFEIFLQKMMSQNTSDMNSMWNDPLLTVCEEKPKTPLTSISDEVTRKKALELGRACYMFASVLMKPAGIQYHVDLAQNILCTAMQNDYLKNELYSHLIKLTSGTMPYCLQAWKLLALALPLYSPHLYSLLWMLRRHIERWSLMKNNEGNLARFCEKALTRSLLVGSRIEGPSKLETLSILARDPTSTTMPHSIPVLLPNGEYHIIDFDGSTDIGDCLSALCVRCGLRPALLSGYALYAEDARPIYSAKRKAEGMVALCDCLSRWERELIDTKCGRVTEESARIRLALRQRHYWSHLAAMETATERLFSVYRMANEIVAGRVPMSNELAEELAALYAQMRFGNISEAMSEEQFKTISTSYFPAKMLDVTCERTLRLNIAFHWTQLRDTSPAECIRMILVVLRKWRLFGSYICEAKMKMRSDEKIFIALNDQGVHLLTHKQLDILRSFPYRRLVSFGGYRNDFMITVERTLPVGAHPEETARERLTFSMPPRVIDQLTGHLAEYIRCQKLVWKLSTQKL